MSRTTSSTVRVPPLFACPWAWIGLSVVLLVLDYSTRPSVLFPITFVFPVALAAWYGRLGWALLFAVSLPAARFGLNLTWETPWTPMASFVNALVRIGVLVVFAILVEKNRRLEKTVKVLEGILPVCGFCRKIRDENNAWHPMEKYISEHSEALFSHSFCPDCAQKYYAEYIQGSRVKTEPASEVASADVHGPHR